jgi:hypothetical protein
LESHCTVGQLIGMVNENTSESEGAH